MSFFRTLLLSAAAGSILFATGCRHPNDPDNPDNPANFGNALQMDGAADYVVVPHAPALALSSGSFAVEAWVRPGSNVYYKWIVAKAASNNNLDYLLGFDRSGQFRFITRSLANDIVSRNVPEPNRWYHVVGVQDVAKGKVYLYVDGELEAWAPLQGEPSDNSAELLLGVRIHTDFPGTLAEYLDGSIDEVRIWNKPLREKDICKCAKPLEGNESGLVAYWNFDEASGADVLDASHHGHDGVFGSTASPERVPSTIPR